MLDKSNEKLIEYFTRFDINSKIKMINTWWSVDIGSQLYVWIQIGVMLKCVELKILYQQHINCNAKIADLNIQLYQPKK